MKNNENEPLLTDLLPPDAVLQPELFPLLPQALVQKLARLPLLRGNPIRGSGEAQGRSEKKRSGAA